MGQVFGKSEHIDFNSEVELRHFNLLRCVGKGAFGKVRIVEHRESKKLYALKYINKVQCIKIRAVQNIIRERYILEEIEHPFIVNLRYAFQDDENMFMVIDLMMGGDLRYHLYRLGGFSEEMIRFFASEISCALNYLHQKNILHRDLKPDNILLDTKGHSHITDFNIATKVDPNKLPRSQSGTLAYMAPEVFKGKGYSYSVDWWGLGVILYECLYGKRPFKGQNNEQLTMSILSSQEIRFPSYNSLTKFPVKVTQDCIMFLKGLLTKDPQQRLGCHPGIGLDELWDHPWLSGIDWDKLERKEYVAPFIPDSERANFDATYDLEELLLEDNPLVHKKKKKKDKNDSKQKSHSNSVHTKHSHKSKLETEIEYIEKHFKVYDSSMFDRCKELIEKEHLFSQLPPEVQQIASQASAINPNYNGKGPSGIVAAKLREKKLQVILFQQHMELQRQMEQKQLEMNEEGDGNDKDIQSMDDLQVYYKKHINPNTSNGNITPPQSSSSQSQPIMNYTQSLVRSNYTNPKAGMNTHSNSMNGKNNHSNSLNGKNNHSNSLNGKNPKNTHSNSLNGKNPMNVMNPMMNTHNNSLNSHNPLNNQNPLKINTNEKHTRPPRLTQNSPPHYATALSPVMNSPTPNVIYNENKKVESDAEIQELAMNFKALSPDSPSKITSPKLVQSKAYYPRSPNSDHLGSPFNRGNKTPTLDLSLNITSDKDNNMPIVPPNNGQELQDYGNKGFFIEQPNSPPLVDTPPRTASVGVLREIIPNPYIKKNPR